MNTTQVLEALIPMLVMLVTVVGLALRFQTNLRRSVDRSIDKFRNELRKNRDDDRKELKDFRTEARTNREDDRKELKDFRAEVLDRFETTNHKIDANTAAIAANTTAIAANAAETNGNIALNTTKIDAIAAAAAGDRERFETFRGDTREDFKELGDKIDTNAATHDRNIRKVGDRVAGFKERVSRVEGYIEATSGGQWPAAGSRYRPVSGRRSLVACHRPDRLRSAAAPVTTAPVRDRREGPPVHHVYIYVSGMGRSTGAWRRAAGCRHFRERLRVDRPRPPHRGGGRGSGAFAERVAAVEGSLGVAPVCARARNRPVERGRRSPPFGHPRPATRYRHRGWTAPSPT